MLSPFSAIFLILAFLFLCAMAGLVADQLHGTKFGDWILAKFGVHIDEE